MAVPGYVPAAIAWLFIVACLTPAAKASVNLLEVTPLEKVLELLGNIDAQLEAQGKEEATAYDKYACFCKDQVTTKKLDIEAAEKKIATLSSEIETLTTDIGRLTGEIGELTEDISLAEQKKEEKQTERNQAHNTFLQEEADLNEGIRSIEGAVKSLQDSKGQMRGARLGGTVGLVAVHQDLGTLADKLLEHSRKRSLSAEAVSFLQLLRQPEPVLRYQYHGNKIIDRLQGLKIQTVAKIKKLKEEEFMSFSQWEKTDASIARNIKFLTLEKKEKEEVLEEKQASKSEKEADKDQTVTDKAADEKFLRELTTDCEEKAGTWDSRSRSRQQERQAIATATETLKEKVSPNAGALKKLTFLQQGAKRSHHRRHRHPEADEDEDADADMSRTRNEAERAIGSVALSDDMMKPTEEGRELPPVDQVASQAESRAEQAAVQDAAIEADAERMKEDLRADAAETKKELAKEDDPKTEQVAQKIAQEVMENQGEDLKKQRSDAEEEADEKSEVKVEPLAKLESSDASKAEPEAQPWPKIAVEPDAAIEPEAAADTVEQDSAASFIQAQRSQGRSRLSVLQKAATDRARIYLLKTAQVLGSSSLLAASARLEAAPDFENVRELLKDLIQKLQEDAENEAQKKSTCDQINDITDNSPQEIEKLNAEKYLKTQTVEKRVEEIAALDKRVEKARNSKTEATALNQEATKTNNDNIKQCQEAVSGIETATQVLDDYYSSFGGGTFVQVDSKVSRHSTQASNRQPGGELAEDPFSGQTGYTGSQESKIAIMGILETTKADFERQEEQTRQDEQAQMDEYNTKINELQADIDVDNGVKATKADVVTELQGRLREIENELKEQYQLHDIAVKQLEMLRASCVSKTDQKADYEARVAAREKEIRALQEAYEVLVNWNK